MDVFNPGNIDNQNVRNHGYPTYVRCEWIDTMADYKPFIPVENRKYRMIEGKQHNIPKGQRTRPRKFAKENPHLFPTVYETVCITNGMSPHNFLNHFVDMSFCRMYFDGKRFHIDNLDHLFQRCFTMNWDISRYEPRSYQSDGRLLTREEKLSLRDRLRSRCMKYIGRGFTCLNMKETSVLDNI